VDSLSPGTPRAAAAAAAAGAFCLGSELAGVPGLLQCTSAPQLSVYAAYQFPLYLCSSMSHWYWGLKCLVGSKHQHTAVPATLPACACPLGLLIKQLPAPDECGRAGTSIIVRCWPTTLQCRPPPATHTQRSPIQATALPLIILKVPI
jgi:hypothetical protein